jgi:hypothetical protein
MSPIQKSENENRERKARATQRMRAEEAPAEEFDAGEESDDEAETTTDA